MNKRFFAATTLLCMMLGGCSMQQGLTVTAQAPTEPAAVSAVPASEPGMATAKIDYNEIYRPILAGITDLMANGTAQYAGPKEGENAIWEMLNGGGTFYTANNTGYAIQDVNGDSIPELLICDISRRDGLRSYGTTIYALYNCSGGTPQLCFEGWSRNRYALLNDNTILNEGSAGAAYSIWGIYALNRNATELECLDYFFTHEKDETFEEIGFYHNLTGEFNTELSEELPMTEEQFWRLFNDASVRITEIPVTPFMEYGFDRFGSFVQVQWLSDATEKPAAYTEFTLNSDDTQAQLLLTPYGIVRDFRLLSLNFRDMDDFGNIHYDIEEIYSLETLTEDRPLVVNMTFAGTIPNNGIRYTNDKGETRTFSMNVSGYDGSLELSEITVDSES